MSFCIDEQELRDRIADTKPGEHVALVAWFWDAMSYECDAPDRHDHTEEKARMVQILDDFLEGIET